jgi:hypothetical protein
VGRWTGFVSGADRDLAKGLALADLAAKLCRYAAARAAARTLDQRDVGASGGSRGLGVVVQATPPCRGPWSLLSLRWPGSGA